RTSPVQSQGLNRPQRSCAHPWARAGCAAKLRHVEQSQQRPVDLLEEAAYTPPLHGDGALSEHGLRGSGPEIMTNRGQGTPGVDREIWTTSGLNTRFPRAWT